MSEDLGPAQGSASPAPPLPPNPAAVARARNLATMRSGATWFYFIAGLSIVNSVLFWAGSNFGFVIGLGMSDAANAIGHDVITGTTGMASAIAFDLAIAGAFAGIGYMARKGAAWAFIVGMVVYVLDALLLAWATDWLSVAFHGLALFYLFRGFQARRLLGALTPSHMETPGMAPPIHPR